MLVQPEMQKYLICTEVINCDSREIRERANFLTLRENSDANKSKALFYFVRDQIKYRIALFQDMDKEKFKATYTLRQGYGFCITKAILLIALNRACGIPSRLHLSDIRNHRIPKELKDFIGTNILAFHGYADVLINGRWLKVNPAFDIELCTANDFIPVEFNGTEDALSYPYDAKGRPHIEYVKDRGSFPDLPLKLILEGLREYYGPLDKVKMAEWNQGFY